MRPALKYTCFILLLVLSACGSGGKEENSYVRAGAAPDTVQSTAVAPKPELTPKPEPAPVPSADPDFTGTFSDSLKAYRVEFLPDTAGLQYIRENVLVRIDISRAQIARLKATFEEEDDFYTVAQDNMYYMSTLEDKAKALGIQVVNTKERYLSFLGINSSVQELYDLEKDSLRGIFWTYIAFNTTRGARQITNIVDADMEKVAHYVLRNAYPAILLEDTALWNLPTRVAAQDSITDVGFWQFLEDYREAASALSGENLWHHPEYQYYDGRIIRYDQPEHPLGIILRREAGKLGYEFTNYHGEPYFSQSPSFVQKYLYPKVTDTMREFLDVFLLSYTLGYWEEGSLTVEPTEIARHIVLWEAFAVSHPDFVQPDYAAREAATLVSYLIDDGVSYNSYFSGQDSALQTPFIDGLKYLISEAPETTSGRKAGEYFRLLEANDFKKTDTVASYLRAYQQERRALSRQ